MLKSYKNNPVHLVLLALTVPTQQTYLRMRETSLVIDPAESALNDMQFKVLVAVGQ